MNILWLTGSYPWPGDPYRGIFFQTQAQALSRQGVNVAVAVAGTWIPPLAGLVSPRHALELTAPRQQAEGDLRIRRFSFFSHRFQNYLGWPHVGMVRQLLKQLPFQPDLIHGHYAYPMGLAAVEAGRQLGIPSVVTLHGSDVNEIAHGPRIGARRLRQTMAGVDRVLCVSRALCDTTFQLTGHTASYLPIGINLKRFPSPLGRAQAREALGLPADRPIILYIGFLDPCKGVPLALEALAHPSLAGALGVFVGAGPLGPLVAAGANCLWRQSVPNTVIPDYLAAADLLILPSYNEGLPTVLVEAGACGTPVIATAVGGIPDLLGEERGTLIPPGSAEALRLAILELLADPGPALRRAALLRSHVLDGFDVDRNAGRLVEIYQELSAKGAALRS